MAMVERGHETLSLTELFQTNIRQEVEFIKRYKDLSPEMQDLYLQESMFGMLDEFVGNIAYKRLAYELREDGLYYAGMRAMDTYDYAASQSGFGSRTWYETEGLKNVQTALLTNDTASATLLSAPSVANYGFAFHFEKDRNSNNPSNTIVYEYLIEYPERKGELSTTNAIATQIISSNYTERFPTSTESYLANPFIYRNEENNEVYDRLLLATGIDDKKLQTSKLFQEKTRKELALWSQKYIYGIQELAAGNMCSLDRNIMVRDLEKVMTAMWNKSAEIKHDIDFTQTLEGRRKFDHEILSYAGDEYAQAKELEHYSFMHPVISIRASDCAPSTARMLSGITPTKVADAFQNGLTIGQQLSSEISLEAREPFKCPKCNYVSKEPVGNQCPKAKGGCGLTKEEYIEEAKKKGIKVC